MTKKTYEKPVLHAELFAPNDYVAACSTTEGYTTYNFVCNAGEGVTHTDSTGGRPGHGGTETTKYVWKVYTNDGTNLTESSVYGACGITHEVQVMDGATLPFIQGYIDNIYTEEAENISVWIWRGDNNDDVHCMLPTDGAYTGPQKNLS